MGKRLPAVPAPDPLVARLRHLDLLVAELIVQVEALTGRVDRLEAPAPPAPEF